MRPLPLVVVSLLLSSLTSSGCARRPELCEDGSRTAPLCDRIEALEHELAEQSETVASVRSELAEQEARVASFADRLAQVEDAVEFSNPTGVPACDDYIRRYTWCIDEKMPEAAKEVAHQALWTSVRAWQKAAATHAGREGLAVACRTAAEAVQTSCGWD